jgi:putative Holliday junction resolvase
LSDDAVYCGIDHGTKRIGLAIADPGASIASPLAAIDGSGPAGRIIGRVTEAVREFDVGAWVIGLPLNMDGSEGPQAKLVREFGGRLADATGKPVHYWDERLSSESADALLAPAALTRKRKKLRRDAVAAQVILQSFLDARRREHETSG